MAPLRDRVDAEFANIEGALAELPWEQACSELSKLELAGVASLLHNFYNGIENVLKQAIVAQGSDPPRGESWHRELVDQAVAEEIITESTAGVLRPYLAFRR